MSLCIINYMHDSVGIHNSDISKLAIPLHRLLSTTIIVIFILGGGGAIAQWLEHLWLKQEATNIDGMKDLWCSSTVWLLSTQI